MATRAAREPAPVAPVAKVCVDVSLSHLDRPFDYLVPAELDAVAVPGVRVRVRFAGQLVDGYLIARADGSAHPGRLTYLDRVVSPEPVLGPEVVALARAVAQRYAGTLADVLRLAVPPRHARAEAASFDVPAGPVGAPDPAGWAAYPAGRPYLAALADGRAPRAVWTALPGEDWPARLAEAVTATVHGGRGAVVIVADATDLDRLDAALRAPYPHAREVLLTRAQQAGAGALLGGYGRSVEAQQVLESGWAREIVAPRQTVRHRAPAVTPTADDPRDQASARLPSLAWRAARDALAAGAPVLVQVPRRGYLPSVACADCRTPARCPHCHGPLALPSAAGTAECRWCGRAAAGYACPECGGRRLRAAVVGARRTAEELGRAFPGVPVRTSGRDEVLGTVPAEAAVVVATPGAEPVPVRSGDSGGYGAVLLLDTWALLTRSDLRAGEEALRRWLAAAALARPAEQGGRVVVVADGGLAPVQALVRFDPGWLAGRELSERRELGFPPAVRMATLTGTPAAVAELLSVARLPEGTDVLGPVPAAEGQERMLLRVPRSAGLALAGALHAAAGVRSAKKAADPVRIQVDPLALL